MANLLPDDFIRAEYAEAGGWSRHYSSVRMALTTFLITLSASLLAWSWDKPKREAKPIYFACSVAAWLIAWCFLIFFTRRFYRDWEYYRQLREVLRANQRETQVAPHRPRASEVRRAVLTDGFIWFMALATLLYAAGSYFYWTT